MKLITLDKPDGDAVQAATHYVRSIFFCKILVSLVTIPLVATALLELPHLLYYTVGLRLGVNTAPLLAYFLIGSFYLAAGLLCIKLFADFCPIFGPLCAQPLHTGLWNLTMFTIGLLVDSLVVVPRLFLGSAIDSLLPQNASSATDDVLFSRQTNAILLVLLPLLAGAIYFAWHPVYRDSVAQARDERRSQAAYSESQEEESDWKEFNKSIQAAVNASMIGDAISELNAIDDIYGLPYRDEQDWKEARRILDEVNEGLRARRSEEQTAMYTVDWQGPLREKLRGLPEYGARLQEFPEPPKYQSSIARNHLSLGVPQNQADRVRTGLPRAEALAESSTESSLFDTQPPPPPEKTPEITSKPPRSTAQSDEELTTRRQPVRDDTTADKPTNPFQKGTKWIGTSSQISDGGINSANNGIQIQVELSINRHDADQFEGLVRSPWVVDAQGRRVRWGATAAARGTYRDGEVTIRTTPLHVPADTVLLPGTWTGTVEDGVFTGEFRGANGSQSEITLQMRPPIQRRTRNN